MQHIKEKDEKKLDKLTHDRLSDSNPKINPGSPLSSLIQESKSKQSDPVIGILFRTSKFELTVPGSSIQIIISNNLIHFLYLFGVAFYDIPISMFHWNQNAFLR